MSRNIRRNLRQMSKAKKTGTVNFNFDVRERSGHLPENYT
jgi:hypothetical protein